MDIEPIGFGPALASIDLNTGGINDVVLDAMCHQGAMQPESVTASLIATHDACMLWRQSAASPGGSLAVTLPYPQLGWSVHGGCATPMVSPVSTYAAPVQTPGTACAAVESLARYGAVWVLPSSLLLLKDKVLKERTAEAGSFSPPLHRIYNVTLVC